MTIDNSLHASRSTDLPKLRVHIRWMIRRDMPEVLLTEQESFEYAWTKVSCVIESASDSSRTMASATRKIRR